MHQSNEAARAFHYFVEHFGTKHLITYERYMYSGGSRRVFIQLRLCLVISVLLTIVFDVGVVQNACYNCDLVLLLLVLNIFSTKEMYTHRVGLTKYARLKRALVLSVLVLTVFHCTCTCF